MLAALPPFLKIVFLGALGLAIGAAINWAIYAWTMFIYRPISPWMKPASEAGESDRLRFDYLPIVGWPGRARDKKVYGKGFWFRPMTIEIAWMIGLPWFYFWLVAGGLGSSGIPAAGWAETWFWLYTVFLALMTAGTFIDFDEKTIPDQVTVTGTIIALLFAAFAPSSRLPEIVGNGLRPSIWQSIDHGVKDWHAGWLGWAVAVSIFAVWIWALMPKLPVWYVGWRKTIRFMYAHAFRPRRKTACKIRVRPRKAPMLTKFLLALLIAGATLITTAWWALPIVNWHSFYGACVGLAFGGGLIWSIRIIGTVALQKEAMGFGDVTLMAMIGATLGWQATLIAFVYAMIVVVLALVVQIIATGNQELAFGPYLCAGAALTIFRWSSTWPFASQSVFALGDFVWWLLAGSLILMALMLAGLQWIKGLLGHGQSDEPDSESETP